MGNIIHYLVVYNQYLLKIIFDLLTFIAGYIPLKQKIHDDSMSPKYQKFKVDRLPIIKRYEKVDWQFLQEYYKWKYGKEQKPIRRRKFCRSALLSKILFDLIFESGHSVLIYNKNRR